MANKKPNKVDAVIRLFQTNGLALELKNAPPSLSTFVKFYRCMGYSFSGVVFTTVSERTVKYGGVLKSIAILVASILLMILLLAPFLWIPQHTRLTTVNEPIKFADYFNIQQYKAEYADIKPILRYIMTSILYIFIIETEINLISNLLTGGQLIVLISDVVKGLPAGTFSLSMIRLVSLKFAVLLGITASSLVLFNSGRVVLLVRYLLGEADLTIVQSNELKKMLITTTYHFIDYVVLSMWSLLFVYVLVAFKQHIQLVRESVDKVSLDEARLESIKEKLTTLCEQFKVILAYFAVPLLSAIVINLIALIGSCCFLMLNQGRSQYYISTLFSFGVYAFLRLILLCWAGNLVTTEYRELVRTVHENMSSWTAEGWLVFIEIRRLREHFSVTFLETFSIKQSTILSTLGFALGYIVLLIQTENYDHAPGAANATSDHSISRIY